MTCVVLVGTCYSSAVSRVEMEASFLYWKADVNGLSYALENDSIQAPSFNWGPGVSLALGYRIPHGSWKIALECISYRTHCESTVNTVVLPVWVAPLQPSVALNAFQHYRLHLGLIDLLLSQSLDTRSRLHLSPYLGLSFASVRQKYQLNYSETILWSMKNKFEGVGPTLGCSGQFRLLKGVSLFGRTGVALLYGQFYTHQGNRWGKDQIKYLRLFNEFFSLAPVMTGTCGLRFQSPLSKSGKQWMGEIGFDQRLFFAQNQLPHFMQNSQPGLIVANQGDLSLIGAHFTAGFAF